MNQPSASTDPKEASPSTVVRWLKNLLPLLKGSPVVGAIDFGSLRQVTPISRHFGYDRGSPIDRYYVEKDISLCQREDFPEPIDGIAHMAATPSVTASWTEPLESHHNNLTNTLAVIKLCRDLQIPRLVFASSAAVYGNPQTLPIAEDHTTVPISPYGLHKLVSEQYAKLFASQWGFSFVGLRMFNVYGPRQAPNSQYSGVISIFTRAMQQGLPITINGDGSQTRDFLYVKDVALAYVKALTISLKPGSSWICNAGTGHAISLLELVNLLKELFPKWHQPIQFAPGRLGDIQDSQADISSITSLLAFSPQWSVQAGLACFVDSLSTLSIKDDV